MAEVLEVERREKVGSAATTRLRREGKVPAVLYGHGESNEHLAVPKVQVSTLIRHHSKTVELKGAVAETALVNHIHWDPLGIEVLHLDLIRVNLKEEVEVTVAIHTRGESVGVRNGGMLLENMHEVDIRCPAGSIPDALDVDVSELDLGAHLTAGDLELPEGVILVTETDAVIVRIEEPKGSSDDDEAESGIGAEPEVIAKGGDSDESDA
ncbi:General stress protein CTC [Rubripirellula obstinata]|uniref:Large ribosomal subunit protein bL25 n=1 Tax=Rubripirellula obstinata TaxID=406547 RepID=A0A5B1CIF0_9BACT|nr:50S ribosomal protein L25 [Rubripirellula obstinata]KAA1259044.1 General stress protein CTC [Rubripirellula obstinata]